MIVGRTGIPACSGTDKNVRPTEIPTGGSPCPPVRKIENDDCAVGDAYMRLDRINKADYGGEII